MFRAAIIQLRGRAHTCGQLSCTWSKRQYYKQQYRKLHQTTWLFSSDSDKADVHTTSIGSDHQESEKSEKGFIPKKLFKPRTLDEGKQLGDGWQDDLEEGDTFGTLIESPEFPKRAGRDKDKKWDFNKPHPNWKKRQEDGFQASRPNFRNTREDKEGDITSAEKFDASRKFDRHYKKRLNYTENYEPRFEQDRKSNFSDKFDSYKRHDGPFKYRDGQKGMKRDKLPRSKRSEDLRDTFGLLTEEGDEAKADLKHDDKPNFRNTREDKEGDITSAEKFDASRKFDRHYKKRLNYTENYEPRFEQDRKSNFSDKFDSYKRHDGPFKYRDGQKGMKRDKLPRSKRSEDLRDTFGLLTEEGDEAKADLKHDDKPNFRNTREDKEGDITSAEKFDASRKFDRHYKKRLNYTENYEPRFEQDRKSNFSDKFDSYKRHDGPFKYRDGQKGMKRDKLPRSKRSEDLRDTFGLLTEEGDEAKADLKHDDKFEHELLQTEMDEKPHIPLGTYNRKHTAAWYSRRIMKLGKQGKVREAIEVFDCWMIKEDHVKPTAFEFTTLIHVLGQVGYTKKAFQLYNQMLRMRIKDIYSPHLFTSLFNACANSPWPEDGLERARKLRTRMLVKDIQPNYIIYNAMIKAFGMCGDINTAFSLADEAAHFFKPDDNLLSSLLVACITDKKSGFRHAIMVWRKMKKMGIEPQLKDYCLLIRVVNECGIGDPELAKDLLMTEELPIAKLEAWGDKDGNRRDVNAQNKRKQVRKMQMFGDIDAMLSKYIDKDNEAGAIETECDVDSTDKGILEDKTNDLEKHEDKFQDVERAAETLEWWQMDVFVKDSEEDEAVGVVPYTNVEDSVLDPTSDFSRGLPLKKLKYRENRLAVIGGYRRILRAMEERNVKADIVLFTQLMQSTPAHCEELLLDEMDMANVKPDITFYNLLLRKRANRNDFEGSKALIKMMEEHDLMPDIRTYGCLALTCVHPHQGYQLLRDMEDANMQPNLEIMTALISRNNFKFKFNCHILRTMERLNIQPEMRFLDSVEKKISSTRKWLAYVEKNPRPGFDIELYGKKLQDFMDYYDDWTKRMDLAKEDHPWASFVAKTKSSSSP